MLSVFHHLLFVHLISYFYAIGIWSHSVLRLFCGLRACIICFRVVFLIPSMWITAYLCWGPICGFFLSAVLKILVLYVETSVINIWYRTSPQWRSDFLFNSFVNSWQYSSFTTASMWESSPPFYWGGKGSGEYLIGFSPLEFYYCKVKTCFGLTILTLNISSTHNLATLSYFSLDQSLLACLSNTLYLSTHSLLEHIAHMSQMNCLY